MLRRLLGVLALGLAGLGPLAAADEFDLVIITPHNEYIREEFGQAFSKHVGRPVNIRWIYQGTGQLQRLLESKDKAVKGGSFDLDVFFGGGVPDHDLAAQQGFLESPRIPAEVLAGIPSDIAGVNNYDARRLWFSAALSSFGILVNQRGMSNQNLPAISAWADLAEPRMFSWVCVADPRKSSSVRVSYELVLQKYGWEKGWPLLMQIVANARVITDSSNAIPNEIATGNVLAGPCIDFFGYAQVAKAGADVLTYVNPRGETAITPDPISLLRKPPHRELAERFIAFVLSAEGQRLWVLPPGAPGGPAKHELRRMSVRPEVCEEAASHALVKNPYAEAGAGTFMKLNAQLQNERTALLAELMGAALVDLHGELKAAWKALIDGGMKPAAVAEWSRPPFSEAESLALSRQLAEGGRAAQQLTRTWVRDFKTRYQKVIELSK